MKANDIVNVLNHFKDSSYQKVLISGSWGIGKTKSIPIDEKVSEKYLGLQDVVCKEIDLISITSSNIKEVVFEELQSL